jgi:hypothetical protein
LHSHRRIAFLSTLFSVDAVAQTSWARWRYNNAYPWESSVDPLCARRLAQLNQWLVESGGNIWFEFVQTAKFYGEPGTIHETEGMYCKFEQRWRGTSISEGNDYFGGEHQHGFEAPSDTQKNNGPNNCVGNPINAANGNKYHSDVDYSQGVLTLRRSYNRYGSGSGAFGTNWDATYFTAVSQGGFGADRALINRADGRVLTFHLNGSQWQADADVADQLVELKDGAGVRTGWKYIVAADDSVETYGANGKLTQIATPQLEYRYLDRTF